MTHGSNATTPTLLLLILPPPPQTLAVQVESKFSRVSFTVTSYTKHTRALTLEHFSQHPRPSLPRQHLIREGRRAPLQALRGRRLQVELTLVLEERVRVGNCEELA